MVLKWPFIDDTGEESAHQIFKSPGIWSSLSRYSSCTWRMALKWPLVSSTGEDSVHSLIRSPGRQTSLNQYGSFAQKMVLKWPSSVVLMETAHSLIRSPGRQPFKLVEFYSEDGLEIAIH